jgi:acetyl-CoA carboxylase biotin carboxyl carrier protein
LSFFFGTAPVMATVMMTGCAMVVGLRGGIKKNYCKRRPGRANMSGKRNSAFRKMKKPKTPTPRAAGAARPPIAAAPAPAAQRAPTNDDLLAIARTAASGAAIPSGGHLVKSPMVGTFYRAPAPDQPPFVEVGARVQADTIVCIIEVMKLMNSVAAGVAGTVTHVLAQNAQPVEAGQPVIAIRPE